jgi:hypothetical protein
MKKRLACGVTSSFAWFGCMALIDDLSWNGLIVKNKKKGVLAHSSVMSHATLTSYVKRPWFGGR